MTFLKVVIDQIGCMPPEQLREWREVHQMRYDAPVTKLSLSRLEEWTPEHREAVIVAIQNACFRWESEPDTFHEPKDIMEGLSKIDLRLARIASLQSFRTFLPWFNEVPQGAEAALRVIERASRRIAKRDDAGLPSKDRLPTWIKKDDERKCVNLATWLIRELAAPVASGKTKSRASFVRRLVEVAEIWKDIEIVNYLSSDQTAYIPIVDGLSFFVKKHARTIGENVPRCFDIIDNERQKKKP